MMMIRLAACALLTISVPSEAYACMTEPLPTAILFDHRPTLVPKDSIAVFVRPVSVSSYTITAKVLSEAPGLRVYQVVEIEPLWPTSCLSVGRIDKAAFVVVGNSPDFVGKQPLRAKSYNRSWLDTFWAIFGIQSFTPTGAALGNPFPG